MGTAEVESSLVAHEKVSEAAVVGYPHDIKGQGIYAYVTLMTDRASRPMRSAQGTGRVGTQGHRPDRIARSDPVLAGPAEDPLRQDHAPHPAQDRRRRLRRIWATPRPSPIPTVVDDLVAQSPEQEGRLILLERICKGRLSSRPLADAGRQGSAHGPMECRGDRARHSRFGQMELSTRAVPACRERACLPSARPIGPATGSLSPMRRDVPHRGRGRKDGYGIALCRQAHPLSGLFVASRQRRFRIRAPAIEPSLSLF